MAGPEAKTDGSASKAYWFATPAGTRPIGSSEVPLHTPNPLFWNKLPTPVTRSGSALLGVGVLAMVVGAAIALNFATTPNFSEMAGLALAGWIVICIALFGFLIHLKCDPNKSAEDYALTRIKGAKSDG